MFDQTNRAEINKLLMFRDDLRGAKGVRIAGGEVHLRALSVGGRTARHMLARTADAALVGIKKI